MKNKNANDPKMIPKYFDNILDVLSDGIYISDSTGMTLKVNKTYEKLTGLRREEMEGRYVQDLLREGKFDKILNPDIVKTKEPKTALQTTKVGRKVVLDGYPVFNEKGEVVLVVTFVRDITLLSQLKEQIAYQQELIEKFHREVEFLYKEKEHSLIVYKSPEMKKILEKVDSIAKTDATVLILGETGTGKDLLARKIHEKSPRHKASFFKVDCTTIPANLIESELFGYEPGAFSGASAKGKPGFVEMSHKGTLFLDEIGELPPPMQGKLLRVLQEQELIPLGSTKVKKVDVRFIAATNRNLEEAVKDGTFRRDLYYRLRVAVLEIPPLRERRGDILPLAHYFLDKYNLKYKKKLCFAPKVEELFYNYNWPGNVREMENLVQSLVVTRDKEVLEEEDLPYDMLNLQSEDIIFKTMTINWEGKSLGQIVEEFERELLRKALSVHGSITQAAKKLKVDRTTIFRKMKKYSLD